MPYLKTLIFTILAPGTVAGVIPYFLISSFGPHFSLGMFRFLGVPLMILGVIGYLWCAFDFAHRGRGTPAPIDPPKNLIVVGLYRWVRNPMYVSVGFLLIGEFLTFGNVAVLLFMLVMWFIFNLFILLYEEPTLRQLFGEDYSEYCRKVGRWVPKIPK